jgi:hypothetical protein
MVAWDSGPEEILAPVSPGRFWRLNATAPVGSVGYLASA